jgi:CRISPR/Cas system-associated protein Cas10 (large subunit of type III CRISPR-Cas system)
MHGVDEAVELASIVDGARTLARFLLAHLGGDDVLAVASVNEVRA